MVDVVATLGATALMGMGVMPFLHVDPTPDAWFSLEWPPELDADRVESLLRYLATTRHPGVVTFELEADGHQTAFRVGVAAHATQRLLHAFESFLPSVQLDTIERRTVPLTRAASLRLTSRERALRTDVPSSVARSILNGAIAAGGITLIQIHLGRRLAPLHVPKESVGLPTTGRAVGQAFRYGLAPLDAQARGALQSKVGDQGFRVSIRIGTTLTDSLAARGALRSAVSGLRSAESPGTFFKARRTSAAAVARAASPRQHPVALNVGELVGLLAWPLSDEDYPGVERYPARRLPVPAKVSNRGRLIGVGTHPSTRRPVAQKPADVTMSTWVLGPTGTGKSTLLANMILSDAAAGLGCLVVDPKADLVDDIIRRLPAHRLDDLVVLDPADVAPVGLNPLHGRSPDLAADSIVSILSSIFPEGLGPRSTDLIYAAAHALASTEDGSIAAIPTLLTNEQFRRKVTARVTDPVALSVWSWFDAMSPQERASVIAPPLNKLRPLLRPAIRAVLAQAEPKFQLDTVFTQRRILLVKLDHRILGSSGVALLASVVVSEAWRAIQRRSSVPQERRFPATVALDEWQTMTHGIVEISDVLARTRGYGVGWILANQNAGQLTPTLRAAVLANARSKMVFQLSAEDATLLAKTDLILDARDFQGLDRYHAYASVVSDGQPQAFASIKTQPLPDSVRTVEEVMAPNRERWGVPREATEVQLRSLGRPHPNENDTPLGSRKRRRNDDGGER